MKRQFCAGTPQSRLCSVGRALCRTGDTMTATRWTARCGIQSWLAVGCVCCLLLWGVGSSISVAVAEDAAEEPAGEAKAEVEAAASKPAAAKKDAAAKKGKDKAAADDLGQRKKGKVGENEELGFRQSQVAAEMAELEERMFRLSESLKALEPENSSRLLVGLKYAREELIQFRMKEVQAALQAMKLSDAVGNQKQLLLKLERLEQMLLSPDLDFQLQLERLRLLREIISRLDAAIKEEEREKTSSEGAAAIERELAKLEEQREKVQGQPAALEELEAAEKKLREALAAEKFAAMRNDQVQNRKATEEAGEMVRQVGDAGAAALGQLTRASGSMTQAENNLGERQPTPASMSQGEALEALKAARKLLADEAERLLNQLRGEVKKRVMEALVQMLEGQIAVRETTARIGPKLSGGSRQLLTSYVGLAKSEERLIGIGEPLIALVEETEFGIALPAALRSVTEAMHDVQQRLAAADASPDVVDAERRIEEDLQALLEAMKQLPSSKSGEPSKPGGPSDRERELNRLVAELKMIRILQLRVNGNTKDADQHRPADQNDISAAILKKIQALRDRQDDIHDVTERLATERGNERP